MKIQVEVYVRHNGDIYPWFNTMINHQQLNLRGYLPVQFEIPNPPPKATIILQLRKPVKKW